MQCEAKYLVIFIAGGTFLWPACVSNFKDNGPVKKFKYFSLVDLCALTECFICAVCVCDWDFIMETVLVFVF